MGIDLDKQGKVQLQQLIGKRLRAGRKAARMTENDVAKLLDHREQTQISLWESGERQPPVLTLVKLAKMYAVPLDWIVGIHDDPIADPLESNQAVIVGAVAGTVYEGFKVFAEALSQHVGVTVAGYNTDRRELREMCVMSVECLTAFRRLRELNPDFDEEFKGGDRMNALLLKMAAKGDEFGRRIENERMAIETIDKQISYAEMQESATQCLMTFTD